MEQPEALGSGAAKSDGDQDPRYLDDRDGRDMHSHRMSCDDYYRRELDYLEREPREDASTRERWKREEARIRAEMELGPMKEESRKKVIDDFERKQRDAKAKARAEEARLIERLEREKREAQTKEMIERADREMREAQQSPQHAPPSEPGLARAEPQPTVADLYQQSLEKGVESEGGFWPDRYRVVVGPPRVCQWSVFGHDGIVTGDEPVSEERLKQLIAELRHTGDRVILIENVGYPHVGDLGCLLELPVEAFYGLTNFPFRRRHNYKGDGFQTHKLNVIDAGIEKVFRKAKMLSFEDDRTKAMLRTLGNPMTATRDLLWFFDSHPEGVQRSHAIMSVLFEVIQKILESLPLLDKSGRERISHYDAMFLEALAAQLEGQLEECRLHWLFCMKELSSTSGTAELNYDVARILCIRAKKEICLIIVDEPPRMSKIPRQDLHQPRDGFRNKLDTLEFPDPSAGKKVIVSQVDGERERNKLDKASKQLSFRDIRNTKSAQQFYELNDDLHTYRKELDTLKEHVTDLSNNLPLYLEGYLDDFLVIKQRHTASLPDQLRRMLDRTKELDKFLIDSFQILTSSVSVYESDQSSRQNELSILITVLAFIYVPLTLVTGIFGMNIVQAPDGFVWWSPLVALLVVVAFTALITMAALEGVKLWRRHRARGTGRSDSPASGSNDDEARTGKVSAWERATSLGRSRGSGRGNRNDDLP